MKSTKSEEPATIGNWYGTAAATAEVLMFLLISYRFLSRRVLIRFLLRCRAGRSRRFARHGQPIVRGRLCGELLIQSGPSRHRRRVESSSFDTWTAMRRSKLFVPE